ncbi:MAG: hypothetical protein KJZ54_16000 [Phycisphaerales bacterium]|nr:hypothetical protein [Phycisphaerales bacterium]
MPRVGTMIGYVAIVVFSGAVPGWAQPSGVTAYELTSIGVLEGHEGSDVLELDEFGRVVGRSQEFNGETHSVLWINGELFTAPPPPGGASANLSGISPTSGLLVGTSLVSDRSRPAAWRIGVGSTLLPLLVGSSICYTSTANDAGWMVGRCSAANRSALWPRLDPPIDLGSLGNQFGDEGANDINALGEIVGRSYNAQRITRPYLWRNGQMIDIGGEPTDQRGFAYGINNHTEVVGYFLSPRRRGFYWFEGRITDLLEPHPLGGIPQPQEINDAGLVVGSATNREGTGPTAVAWDKSQQFQPIDLNDCIPRHADVTLVTADDVNEAGQIAAFGEYDDGRERGMLVTPYLFEMSNPEPGRAGTMNTITVTGLQPNQRVHLVWGTREGAQKIHGGCPGGTLLIRDPQGLPAVRADANGVATITVNVPPIARGRTVRLQAVAPIECQISHTVTWTFE